MMVYQENQDYLVKSLLPLALRLCRSLDHQGQLGPLVLLDPLVCLVSPDRMEYQDYLVLKENAERGGMLVSQVSACLVHRLSVLVEQTCLDCVVHQDHQAPLEHLVFKVLLVKVYRVPLDAEVLLDHQVLVDLDLQDRKESQAALCLPQKPFLLDHQGRAVQLVLQGHKGTQVNLVNQVFQEVQGNQVMVSQVNVDQLVLRVHQAQRGQRDHKGLKVIPESLASHRLLAQPLVVHTAVVHLAHLAHLVHLEEMDQVLDQLMWASILQNTFTVGT